MKIHFSPSEKCILNIFLMILYRWVIFFIDFYSVFELLTFFDRFLTRVKIYFLTQSP